MNGPSGATASIALLALDEAGNWPMTVAVKGLPQLPKGQTYGLWLTRNGKLAESCGTFVVGRRHDRGAAERAVPAEGVRRLGRRADRHDEAVSPAHDDRLSRAVSSEAMTDSAAPVVRTQYEDFARHVLAHGEPKSDRTGTGTVSVFGHQMRFDLSEGFPLVTTKKVHFPSIAYELLWFLRGDGNVRWLQEHGVTIWDEWADEDGDLGPVYGVQWRSWPTPDGDASTRSPTSCACYGTSPTRAGSSSARGTSPTCRGWRSPRATPSSSSTSAGGHDGGRGRLSCQLYQRSADVFLGVPFNIASYALLTHMLAQQCDLEPGDLVWTGGDCHVYDNHREQIETQLARDPYPYPSLVLRRRPASIFDYEFEDFEVVGYGTTRRSARRSRCEGGRSSPPSRTAG